jgi:hypothetical protein
MPIFKLDTPTEAKLTAFTPRTEHHGEDLVSAMSLALTITGPNTILDLLSSTLRQALYMRGDDETQEALDGIDPPTPKLRTKHLSGALALAVAEISGGTLFVEWGIGDDMSFGDCKVGKWRVEPMEGGTCSLHFRVSTSDVDEQEAGHLFGKQGQVIMIRFEPPKDAPAGASTGPAIDGTKGHPGAGPLFDGPDDADDPDDGAGGDPTDATDAFVAAHGVGPEHDDAGGDDDGDDDDRPAATTEAKRGGPAWPFPDGDPRATQAATAPAHAQDITKPGRQVPAAKYRDPETGQTWSGRGLKPRWLVAALDGGKTLADFAVERATA